MITQRQYPVTHIDATIFTHGLHDAHISVTLTRFLKRQGERIHL